MAQASSKTQGIVAHRFEPDSTQSRDQAQVDPTKHPVRTASFRRASSWPRGLVTRHSLSDERELAIYVNASEHNIFWLLNLAVEEGYFIHIVGRAPGCILLGKFPSSSSSEVRRWIICADLPSPNL